MKLFQFTHYIVLLFFISCNIEDDSFIKNPEKEYLAIKTDTTFLDKRNKYLSNTDTIDILKYKSKNIYYRANYSREMIHYPNDSFKIEHVFCYDNKRYVRYNSSTTYKIRNKELHIKMPCNHRVKYEFEQQDSLYLIQKELNEVIEYTKANSIIPLNFIEESYGILNKIDTIYKIDMAGNLIPKQKKIKEKIYNLNEVDKRDQSQINEILKHIELNYINTGKPICEGQIEATIVIEFILSKFGEIENIRFKTNQDFYTDRDVLISLKKIKYIEPFTLNDFNVNTKLMIPIKVHFLGYKQ